jgi:hypothetical protein
MADEARLDVASDLSEVARVVHLAAGRAEAVTPYGFVDAARHVVPPGGTTSAREVDGRTGLVLMVDGSETRVLLSEGMEGSMTQWLDHPIVRHARHNLPRDASALDLMEGTLRVMMELEARFPGVPFADILSAAEVETDVDTSRLRATFEAAGVSKEDMLILLPDARSHRKFSDGQLHSLRSKFACRRGTIKQFAKEHGMSKATIYRLIKGGWQYASLAAAAGYMSVLVQSSL